MRNFIALIVALSFFLVGCDSSPVETTGNIEGSYQGFFQEKVYPDGSNSTELILTIDETSELEISGELIDPKQGIFNLEVQEIDYNNPNLYFVFYIVGVPHSSPYIFEGEFNEGGTAIRAEVYNDPLNIRTTIFLDQTN